MLSTNYPIYGNYCVSEQGKIINWISIAKRTHSEVLLHKHVVFASLNATKINNVIAP